MRIVTEKTLRAWAGRHSDAASWLRAWLSGVERADWRNLADVRRVYPSADGVEVRSGKIATVFNVAGNKYRMITAIHYNRGVVFLLLFLTHAEYSKNNWKNRL